MGARCVLCARFIILARIPANRMAAPEVNGETFFRRLNRLYERWEENKSHNYFGGGVDAFCILAGKANEDDSSYRVSAVTQVSWRVLGFVGLLKCLRL